MANRKYKFFHGRAAWTVVGHGKCKAGVIMTAREGMDYILSVAHTRYLTSRWNYKLGWQSTFMDWL